MWTFRNEAKIYGSPMFDAAWTQLIGEGEDPMPKLMERLTKPK